MNPPELTLRTFTNDQQILDKCFYANNYQIKGFKEESEQPIVVDIGAHVGYFSFSALALGAKKVYAIEPYYPNFKLLQKNISINEDRVVLHNFGIYTEYTILKFNHPELQNGIFFDYSDIDIEQNKAFEKQQVISLDKFLTNYIIEDGIDILKISIGYAELDILENCININAIESICGETSENAERVDQFKNKMKEKGYNEFYISKNPEEEKFTFLLSKTNINKHFNIKKST
jgi:FkbM family methyltransferase